MQRSDPTIGKEIDGYRILDLLGKGGMGIVYKAEDIALSREVALKMIAPDLASKESFMRRFQSEARALARVDSPYIVSIHALRKQANHVFIVMEFVEGWTLADELYKGNIEESRSHSIVRQMLQAFAHAHSVGVVHRDIKPSNIMITPAGSVKVTDFGLAKLRREDGMSTVTQGIAGTARYMSPEQVQGSRIDHRSDIYSLGMTMYEMFAGTLPFDSDEGTYSILKRVVEESFTPVVELNPGVSPELSAIIAKAIQKKPEDRFQSAEEMLEVTERAFAGGEAASTNAHHTGTHYGKPPQSTKRPKKWIPFAIAAVILSLIYPVYALLTPSNNGSTTGSGTGQTDSTRTEGDIYAQVAIRTSPENAYVYVNDVFIGESPVEYPLLPGTASLRVELAGYEEVQETVVLQAGLLTSKTYQLVRDGNALPPEATPGTNERVLPETAGGETRPTETRPTETTVGPESRPSNPTPPPIVRTVMRLRAEPAGRVYVDGRRFENQSEEAWPVGESYAVRFESADGQLTGCQETITLRRNEPVDLVCHFEHNINVNARPTYAYLTLNGDFLNETTPITLTLTAGAHSLLASRNGWVVEDGGQVINIEPSFEKQTHRVVFELKKE